MVLDIKSVVLGEFLTVCHMVSGDDYAIIIDPSKFTATVKDFAEKNKDKGTRLILLTHCHYDHTGGAPELREFWDAPICIGKDDAEGLCSADTNLSGRYASEPLSFTADRLLFDGEVIKLGEEAIKVMKTPGHTAGSVCYIADGVIFSGDTLFYLTAGRCDFPGGNTDELMKSLLRLKNLESDYRVLPGHGIETTLNAERVKNRYMKAL